MDFALKMDRIKVMKIMKNQDVDITMETRLMQKRNSNEPISSPPIREINWKLGGPEDFKTGVFIYIPSFQHEICELQIQRVSLSVDLNAVKKF